MLPLQIGEIALACKGEAHGEAQVTSVCIDSRKISQGCLFIAIKGIASMGMISWRRPLRRVLRP
mgnify:CR=1 FL=1